MSNREAAIRIRAYELWEQAGYPQGDGKDFWFEAEAEFEQERQDILAGASEDEFEANLDDDTRVCIAAK